MFIVLFKDGSMMPFNSQPEKKCFAKDAKLFEVEEGLPIYNLSTWAAYGYNWDRFFTEIKDW